MAAVSVLSDGTIRRLVDEGRIRIDPWDAAMVQPASVDLRLGRSFRVFENHNITTIDLAAPPRDLTKHVEIPADGSFVIHPGEFVLGRTEEVVELGDDLVARIEGKALALDTEVPTPSGWRAMGDLRAGDLVFGMDGEPTLVVAATDVLLDRPCAEVVFSDGTRIVADLAHQWVTESEDDRRRGRGPQVRTTAEIAASVRCSATDDDHIVGQAPPVAYPARRLPIDPYDLGARIGDRTSAKAEIASVGAEVLEGTGARGRVARPPVAAERIPEEYLQASVDQRRELLAGLMDGDGCVDGAGRRGLATIDAGLAEQYAELIAGLGFEPVIATRTATLHGRVCGLRHEVTFAADGPVFRVSRKHGHSIVAVTPVPSVPVRCIEVADPRGVFLVTRRFVMTHNSSLGRLGLIVHATAGFVDPGFRGSLTLEITNLTRVPIVLRPGRPIAQLSFMTLDRAAERPYGHPDLGSHYHGQVDATESRYEGGPGSDRRD